MRFEGSIESAQRADVTDVTYIPQERRKIALEQALPDHLRNELRTLREAYESVLIRKKAASRVDGVAPIDLVNQLKATRDAYFYKIRSYRDQYPEFFRKISRQDNSVEVPPPPDGKHACGHTIPIATSSLHSFFPGNYARYQQFLARHNALYRAPESVASKGAMFVEPPRLNMDLRLSLLETMQRQHALWREAPWVTVETTRADVLRLLSHYDSDFTAFVIEDLGARKRKNRFNFLGVVDRERLAGEASTAEVKDFMIPVDDVLLENIRDIEPLAAAHKLLDRPYIVHLDEDGRPKIMTRTVASWLDAYEPFRNEVLQQERKPNNRGLGYVSYIGVSDKDRALKEIDALYRKGQRRFMIETAHMHRTDTVYDIVAEARERWSDIFISSGTVSTPEAVVELSTFVDAVKVGIAFGDICDTNEVAVQPAELEMQIECASAAQGVVSLIVDNLGTRKAFSIKVGAQECIAVQSGGSSVTRRDSANPIGLDEHGNPCKRVDGEAGLGAVMRDKDAESRDPEEALKRWRGYHTEGRTNRWKRVRNPDTLHGFYGEVLSAPPSTESYTGHTNLKDFQGSVPGEGAEIQIVRSQTRTKGEDELYVQIRKEEVDIFDTVQTYKDKFQ